MYPEVGPKIIGPFRAPFYSLPVNQNCISQLFWLEGPIEPTAIAIAADIIRVAPVVWKKAAIKKQVGELGEL